MRYDGRGGGFGVWTPILLVLHSSQGLLGDNIMKDSLTLLLVGLALIICSSPCGQGVYWVSPSIRQLIQKAPPSARQFPLDLNNTILKFYPLEMNSKFWDRYEQMTRNCLKINSFWSTFNQITIACLQPIVEFETFVG